jgi:hypothetical protein
MAHEPKLEIYKLKLKDKEEGRPTHLRELLRKKFNEYPPKDFPGLARPIQPADILNIFFADLINQIDKEGFNKNEHKKKGFTIASLMTEGGRQADIKSFSDSSILLGFLEGGKYGRKRSLKDIDHKSQGTSIEIKHVVGDKFYFLLYTPLDESTLIVMIQGYTETRIADVFVKFLQGYFKYQKKIICEVEHFIPKSLRDRYIRNATFKSMSFSSGWKIRGNFDNDFQERDYDLEVRIVITDKSDQKARHKSFRQFFQGLARSTFKLIDTEEKPLEDFGAKRAKMESRGKEFPINFDDEDEIRPTILLTNEGIRIEEGLIPNFDDVDKYCKELLLEIKDEINPQNAIGRI